MARMVVSQVAGLLTDNFALKRMYVASEVTNQMGSVGLGGSQVEGQWIAIFLEL